MIAALDNPVPSADIAALVINTDTTESPSRWLQQVFRQRFRDVSRYLKRTSRTSNDNQEDVHQLRVACRRSVAALDVLEIFLPRKRTRKLKRTLKAIRRSAGESRDVDVFIERVRTDNSLNLRPGKRRKVLRFLRRLRRKARKPLRKTCRCMRERSFKKTLRQFIGRVPRRGAKTPEEFATNARGVLQQSIDEFRVACSHDLATAADLHALRIAGKKLRYTLEIFRNRENDEQVQPVLRVMKEFQERLGSINDHVAAAERIQGWLKGVKKSGLRRTLRRLAKHEQQLSDQTAQEFREWFPGSEVRSFFDEMNDTAPCCSPPEEITVHVPFENERQLSQHDPES